MFVGLGEPMKTSAVVIALSLLAGACASSGTDVNGDGRFTMHDEGLAANGPVLSLSQRWEDRFESAYAREDGGGVIDGELRRELARSLIAQSNAKCDNYLVGITGAQNSADIGLNLTQLALTTAGGLASPEESANLLSSLATFFGATNRELKDNLFGGREIEVIAQAVLAARSVEEQALRARIEGGAFDRWDGTSVLHDVHDYDQKCGIGYGLRSIAAAVEVARTVEARRVREAAPEAVDATVPNPAAPPPPRNPPQPAPAPAPPARDLDAPIL